MAILMVQMQELVGYLFHNLDVAFITEAEFLNEQKAVLYRVATLTKNQAKSIKR